MLLVLLALACGPKAAEPAPSTSPVRDRMATHLSIAIDAQQAVVQGDLDAAKGVGSTLAELEKLPDFPDSWRVDLAELQLQGQRLADAPDLATAADAVARIGVACGACHGVRGGPEIDTASIDHQAFREGDRMRAHEWAANWMWLGLIGPSTSAYDEGLRVLAEDAPMWARVGDPRFRALQTRIDALVTVAGSDRDPYARVETYAEFLATCADCHATFR